MSYHRLTTALLSLCFYLPSCFLFSLSDARDTGQVLVTIPPLQHLEISRPVLHLPEATREDLNRGYIEVPEGLCLDVCSNIPWKIVLYTNDRSFSRSKLEGKPLEHFQWRVSGAPTPYHSLDRRKVTLYSSHAFADHELICLDIRLALDDDTDKPGDYGLDLSIEIEPLES